MKRLLVVITLAFCPLAFAEGKAGKDSKVAAAGKDPKAAGGVNWEGEVLKATGSGAPDMKASSAAQARLGAEMAAKMDAFRNLLAQAKGIKITSGETVGDAMAKDEIRGRVEGVIRGYRVTDKRYFSDQGVEIDVEVPLAALSAVVYTPDSQAPALNTGGDAAHTGLVVDARGLKLSPALAPRLLDASGKPLYTPANLSEEARKQKAPAAYVASADAAKKSGLVGEKPLTVKAVKADGADLVLDAEGAQRLSAGNNAFLAEGRVAIVTDSK